MHVRVFKNNENINKIIKLLAKRVYLLYFLQSARPSVNKQTP